MNRREEAMELEAPLYRSFDDELKEAPTRFLDTLRYIGPGLVMTAGLVGSGELIVAPKLGASSGFSLLWFIILSCIVKVFVQFELGRFAVVKGKATLDMMDLMPGKVGRVSWLVALWVPMVLSMVIIVAGMLGAINSVVAYAIPGLPPWIVPILVGSATAALGWFGRYRVLERVATTCVLAFTFTTILASVALAFTEYRVTWEDLGSGLSFRLPADLSTAFAAFGVTGVGALELLQYPYWCLKKGYATYVGPREGSPEWRARAEGWLRVMNVDVWAACCIYTICTVCFYVLGAAVLHRQGKQVGNANMINLLALMYKDTFGSWSLPLFLVGSLIVLYSTVLVLTTAFSQMGADAIRLFGVVQVDMDAAASQQQLANLSKYVSVALAFSYTLLSVVFGAPVTLVTIGATVQGFSLPFLSVLAVYLNFLLRRHGDVQSPLWWNIALYTATTFMILLGLYQVYQAVV